MKWPLVIFILLGCTLFATWYYHKNISAKPVEMDYVIKAVSPLKAILPPNANIAYQDIHIKSELSFWIRYALAPRSVSWNTAQYDTLLTVSPVIDADSILHHLPVNRKVLWQNTDTPYYYILTSVK